jgi:hypothetical protein
MNKPLALLAIRIALAGASTMWVSAACAQTTPAPDAKPATAGKVYRCGNQYVERPCSDGGGKEVQINKNSSTPGGAAPVPLATTAAASPPLTGAAIPGRGPRPPAAECKAMRDKLKAQQSQARGKSGAQEAADQSAKVEAAGC